MRVLLDENLNWRLKYDLVGHEVNAVSSLGWSGTKNGALLSKAAENGFQVLITMDNNMTHQQDLSAYAIAVVVLRARSSRLEDIRPLVPAILLALPHASRGAWTLVE